MAQIKINNIIYGTSDATEIMYNDITVAEKLDTVPIFDIEDNTNIKEVESNYLTYGHIIDGLNSDAADKVLSAKQGKILNEKINNIDLNYLEDGIDSNTESINNLNNSINTNLFNMQDAINKINSNITIIDNRINDLNNKRVLLWSNPCSTLEPQTIPIDLNNYNYIDVEFTFVENINDISSIQRFKVGSRGQLSLILYNTNTDTDVIHALNSCHRIISISTSGITFEEGNMIYNGNVYKGWNGRCVPRNIYGIK